MKSPSLFLRLTLFSILATIMTLIAVFLFVDIFFDQTKGHHRRINFLSRLLSHHVFQERSISELVSLGEEMNFSIRYRGREGVLVTDEDMPTFRQLRHYERRHYHRLPPTVILLEGDDDNLFLLSRHRGGLILLGLGEGEDDQDKDDWLPALILSLIGVLGLVWGIVYILIRRQLTPLVRIREDMEKVGRGQWQQLQVTRDDEIGLLVKGFNDMQTRLKAMMEARERFLIDASHELRSPITRLKLTTEFIQDEEINNKLKNDLNELEELTTDILRNARFQSDNAMLHKEKIEIKQWFEKILQTYTSSQQLQLQIQYDNAIDLYADEKSLTVAINNLLTNALKYANTANIVVTQMKEGVQIVIYDDGPGVDNSDLSRLFEPFYRTDLSRTRDTGGFGLGLSIVAAIVKAHGGTIQAHNRQTNGLEITIFLPREGV